MPSHTHALFERTAPLPPLHQHSVSRQHGMSGDSAAGSLRQALAIAVVRSKRQHATEAAELRARAERAEAQLRQQQQQHTQLQEWAASLVRLTTGSSSPGHSVLAADERGAGVITTTCSTSTTSDAGPRRSSDSIFLPPLTLSLPGPGSDGPAAAAEALQLQDGYQQLQEQLVLSAAAAATGSGGGAAGAAEVQGRAATLGAMLLHNLRMLQLLQPQAPGTQHASSGTGHAQGSKAAAIDDLSSFVSSTLLHAPKSSLSAAYARRCAALLAALLTPGAAPPTQPAHEQPQALAAQAVQLLQHVVRTRLAPELGAPSRASLLAAAGPRQPALSAAAAATALLQEMSAFPSTALLMALVTAQQLAALVQQQREAWTGLQAAAELATPASSGWRPCLQDAASTSAAAFQASFALVDDLENALRQLPGWGVALAGCCWTAGVLEDLVAASCAAFAACRGLQQQAPLLAGRICPLTASLATALQQLASNADAPGMRSGAGAELRSVAGGLCWMMRDLFMPGVSPV